MGEELQGNEHVSHPEPGARVVRLVWSLRCGAAQVEGVYETKVSPLFNMLTELVLLLHPAP
jgi:hypothetical protein